MGKYHTCVLLSLCSSLSFPSFQACPVGGGGSYEQLVNEEDDTIYTTLPSEGGDVETPVKEVGGGGGLDFHQEV